MAGCGRIGFDHLAASGDAGATHADDDADSPTPVQAIAACR
jgi:hypothetical protein